LRIHAGRPPQATAESETRPRAMDRVFVLAYVLDDRYIDERLYINPEIPVNISLRLTRRKQRIVHTTPAGDKIASLPGASLRTQ
jgi:hypothetical protein